MTDRARLVMKWLRKMDEADLLDETVYFCSMDVVAVCLTTAARLGITSGKEARGYVRGVDRQLGEWVVMALREARR